MRSFTKVASSLSPGGGTYLGRRAAVPGRSALANGKLVTTWYPWGCWMLLMATRNSVPEREQS